MSGLFITRLDAGRLAYYFSNLTSGKEDCRKSLNPDEVEFFGNWSCVQSISEQLDKSFDELRGLRSDDRFIRPIRNVGYDLCFVAPKQISIVQALWPDDLAQVMLQGFKSAVAETLGTMEPSLNWKSGARLSAVGFLHYTSRALDPHLHTHLILANRVEVNHGVLRAVNSDELFSRAGEWSKCFRQNLAKEVHSRLGMVMIARELSQNDGPTQIPGFPREVSDLFSKRTFQVGELLGSWGSTAPGASRTASLMSRAAKVGLDPIMLKRRWRNELSEAGYGLDDLKRLVPRRSLPTGTLSNVKEKMISDRERQSFAGRLESPNRGEGWVKLVTFDKNIYQRMEAFSVGRVVGVFAGGKCAYRDLTPDLSPTEAFADPLEIVFFGRIDEDVLAKHAYEFRHRNLVIALSRDAYERCDSMRDLPVTTDFEMFKRIRALPNATVDDLQLKPDVPYSPAADLGRFIGSLATDTSRERLPDLVQSHLIFPTRMDRDLARAEVIRHLGKQVGEDGFYHSEPVWVHYAPKGTTLGERRQGRFDLENRVIRLTSEGQDAILPIDRMNLKTMVSPLLVMSSGDAKRAFGPHGQIDLRLGEFAHFNSASRAIELYAGREICKNLSLDRADIYPFRGIDSLLHDSRLVKSEIEHSLFNRS